MKLKITICIICTFMLSLQLIAQRTVTNKGYGGRIVEQYNVNANGNRHGVYKTWNRQGRLIHESNWANGVEHGRNIDYDGKTGAIQRDAMMHNGQITSLKVYSYNIEGTKRSLVREGTWLKDGTILTSREFDPVYNKWIESAGKLLNGRFWYDKYGYNEKYNANDTVYVWSNKDKEIFEGKYLDGIRVYTKEESIIMKDKAIKDSIAYVKEREEENRMYLMAKVKEQAIRDSIEQVKTKYNILVSSIIETNRSYKDLLTNDRYSTEYKFYSFLCKYIKKKNDTDSILSNMIMNVLGINNVKDLEIKAILLESNVTGFHTTYTNEGITITNKQDKTKITALTPYYNANSHFTTNHNWNLTYTVPEDILANYSKQKQLLDIILYCKEHNIVIK